MDELKAFARFYGIPFEPFRQELVAHAVALDERPRTFNRTVYATIEEMDVAKAEAEDISRRTFEGKVFDSEAEAEAARSLDERPRTFNGHVYSSQKEAGSAFKGQLRTKSVFFWLSVLFVPFPTAIFTLQKSFINSQRVIALGWLAIVFIVIVSIFGISNIISFFGFFVFGVLMACSEAEIRFRGWLASKSNAVE